MDLRLIAALVAAALLAAACGSTAQVGGVTREGELRSADASTTDLPGTVGAPQRTGDAQGAGSAGPRQPDQRDHPGVGLSGGQGDTGQRAPTTGSSGDRPAREPAGATSAPTGSALQGVTDESVTVGFAWRDDRNQVSSAIGAGETDFADTRRVLDTIVDWVNANGGINGRELVPYYRPFTTAESTQQAQFEQALCAEFTQDQDLYASLGPVSESFVSCLAAGGVPSFSGGVLAELDTEAFQRLRGFLYNTSALDLTRYARLTAQAHVAMGHLTPDSTVGVITMDQPSYERAAKVFETELAEHGIDVAETVSVNFTGGDYGSAQISNTVLRFRQQGVDRVAVLETNGFMWWEFTAAAEAQGYRPKYVLNPSSFAEFWIRSGTLDPRQVEGSKGIATHTLLHINTGSMPHQPEGRTTCRQILDAGGMEAGSEDDEAIQLIWCDPLRLLKVALDRTTDLSPAGLQASVESLGRTFTPAMSFGRSYHGPGFHSGAGTYVTFEYSAGCTCFPMTSDILSIPGIPQ